MNKKLIMIIAAVIVVVIVIGLLYVFVFSNKEVPYVRTEYSPGAYFVTNLKDSNRLLKITVVLELNTDTLQEILAERNVEIRDTIITVLRDQEESVLRQVDLSDLKAQLASALNEKLEIDNITGILFSDIAIQ